jgi:hypothetical protein
MKNHILTTLLFAIFVSCQFNTPSGQKGEQVTEIDQATETMTSNVQQGIAKEILQTSNYTYILLNSNGNDIWIAVTRMDASVGTKYFFIENMKMENFQSKELNKFFDVVLFVQKISTSPDAFDEQARVKSGNMPKVEITKQNIKIDFPKGTTTIADLYSNKKKYEGTVVTVKGIVTKYNAEIMGKNWIHIQDGTESEGKFDLTIATKESFKMGETITFTGKLSLDKDFGAGYKYEIILEDVVKL